MHTSDHVARLLTATACSGDGRPIGVVTAAYVDATGHPAWVGVRIEPGGTEHLVSLARSWLHPGARLVVPVTRRLVQEAPVAPGTDLTAGDEDELHRYYAAAMAPTRTNHAAGAPGSTGTGEVRLRRVTMPDPIPGRAGG